MMENEGLVVCCSKTALELCAADVELANYIVMSNIVPEGEVYIIDKELFQNWLDQNGVKGWKGEF